MKKKLQLTSVLLFTSMLSFAQWTQVGADIDGEAAGDRSGSGESVSLSSDGNVVAIGAYNNDGNGDDSGHVRVYKNTGGNWAQIGKDIDGEAAGDESGFSVSLSSDGSVVAIGAPNNDGNGSNSGHVRVYKNTGGIWIKIGNDIDGEAADDLLGFSVSLSSDGSVLAIGATGNDENGNESGDVRVYKNTEGTWIQVGTDIDGEAFLDWSGCSVSLNSDGSVLAIGATGNDGNGFSSGHVRVYKNTGGTWTQVGNDIDGEAAYDRSGFSVSLNSDGSVLAIGAYLNDGNGRDSGHVRVYKNTGGTWTQVGTDMDGEAALDDSGRSVSLSSDGSVVAIGAPFNDRNGSNSGHVRVYKNTGGNWIQIGTDMDGEAAGDWSGSSVSLSSDGSVLAIGAHFNDGNGEYSGHVRVYTNTDPKILSSSATTIEGLSYTVVNGSLSTNQKEVMISITDVLGKPIANKNLQGIYIVTFANNKGERQINKLLIE